MVAARFMIAALVAALRNSPPQDLPQNRLDDALQLEQHGDLEGATRILREIAGTAERSQPHGMVLPAILCKLASIAQDQARYRDAERLYRRSVELWRAIPNGPYIGLAQALNNLASLYFETGRKGLAENLCHESLSIRLQVQGPDHPDVALEYSNLAVNAYRRKRYREAESLAWKAIAIWNRLDPNADESDFAYNTLALISIAQSQTAEALRLAARAIEMQQRKPKPSPLLLASYRHTLARVYIRGKRWNDAEAQLQEALKIVNANLEVCSVEKYGLLADDAIVLRRTSRKAAAISIEKEIESWQQEVIRINGLRF